MSDDRKKRDRPITLSFNASERERVRQAATRDGDKRDAVFCREVIMRAVDALLAPGPPQTRKQDPGPAP